MNYHYSAGATVFNQIDIFVGRDPEKIKKTGITRTVVCFFMQETGALHDRIHRSLYRTDN